MDERRTAGKDSVEPYSQPLSISVDRVGDRSVVTLNGELDLASVDAFSSALHEAGAAGSDRIEIDARELTFVDSAGLQALLIARRDTVAAGGSFVLRRRSAALKRMLELAGLAETFAEPDEQ